MRHRIFTNGLMGIVAMLVTLAWPNRAGAAISQGPHYTNAIAAEQQRILDFYQAQQSYQEQLKVGQKRYDQKQAKRAQIIAGMAEELQARQQTVVIQSVAAADGHADGTVSGSGLWLAVAVLSIGLGGIGVYLNRQRRQNTFGQ
jgi:hypothetical protein